MAVNRITLTQGNLYKYEGTDGSYSLLLGGVSRVDESDLVISGSSYLGDSSSDRVQITGSLKSRHITGSIHTIDGTTPFITQGSNTTVSFDSSTGQWTISSTAGGGTPGGSDTQVQFNDGGSAFGGDSGLTFNKSTDTLTGVTGSFYRVVATALSASSGNLNLSLGGSGKVTVAGDLEIDGNNILASNGSTNITLTSNTLTTFAGDIKITGNDIQSSTGTAISLSGVSATIAGDLQVTGNQIKSNTGAVALQITGSSVTVSDNLVVSGSTRLGNNSGDLTAITGSFSSRHITGSIHTIDGSTPLLAQSGNATVSFNNSTGQWTIGASGGGGTPGGASNQVQLADSAGTAFSGSGGLWFTSSGNRLYVSGNMIVGGTTTIDIPATKDISLFPTLGNNTITIGALSLSKLLVGAQMGVYNGVNISGNDIQSSSGAVAIRLASSDTEHRGRTYFNGDLIPSTGLTSINVLDTVATTIAMAGAATTLNIGNASAAQTITVGGSSTGASTYNLGTGASSNGNNKTINIGTGNAAGSNSIVNIGTSQGGKTTVSGSLSYKGDLYASNIQVISVSGGVSGTARYVRVTATADVILPALSETVHGRVLTISNMIAAGGTATIKPDGTENVIVLGTTGLGSVALDTQRQWVELVAKYVSGANDNGWYAVCGGVVPTLA